MEEPQTVRDELTVYGTALLFTLALLDEHVQMHPEQRVALRNFYAATFDVLPEQVQQRLRTLVLNITPTPLGGVKA